jgi:D-aspartate ligase
VTLSLFGSAVHARSDIRRRYLHQALVVGRIGLVRCLGREGIPVALARESDRVFARASRYCQEFIRLPNLSANEEEAVEILEKYGRRQEEKPIVFMNAESDVLLFSKYREQLSSLFHIMLAPHDLLVDLINKNRFARLAGVNDFPVPRTLTPESREECLDAADQIGYPCIIKPIRQRQWQSARIINKIGYTKAVLVSGPTELKAVLDLLPPIDGHEMVQQYIPGNDQQHYDLSTYIDPEGRVRGCIIGHKLRTYPVHFGSGCYTRFVDEPAIEDLCLNSLKKIGYTGVADVNLKRHAETGQYYILEINPRYSLWSVFNYACGVNLPLLQYCDVLGIEMPDQQADGRAQRWLWFGNDFKSLLGYRRVEELTVWGWVKSFFIYKGKIEFHVFAWDDPIPLAVAMWLSISKFLGRLGSYIKRRMTG